MLKDAEHRVRLDLPRAKAGTIIAAFMRQLIGDFFISSKETGPP
jgi:hypothetical protein